MIAITVAIVTIVVSANCSLYEAILYSTRIGTLESLKSKGHKPQLVERMLGMKRNISAPIAAILILNTIANTAGATVAGMYAAKEYGPESVVVFSTLFTLGILFFAEIAPKTLGAIYWRTIWTMVVWPLHAMKTALTPFIWCTEKFTRLLTAGHHDKPVTEDDIIGTAKLGAQIGEISEWESVMVHNIIHLEERDVTDVLTPRTVLTTISAESTIDETRTAIEGKGFTRIPIYQDDRENLVGYVHWQALSTREALAHPETPVTEVMKPLRKVPENTNCLTLLATLLKHREHIAVIHDAYGGVAGIVTLEDLLESILGREIVDEQDAVVDLQAMARAKGRSQLEMAPKKPKKP